jgi:hypothetical protein
VVENILRVHHRWTARLTASHTAYADQLNAALVALGGKKLPPDIMQAALARTEFTDDPLPQTFATMEGWSHELKFINSAPDLTPLFATDIIHKVQAEQPATQP